MVSTLKAGGHSAAGSQWVMMLEAGDNLAAPALFEFAAEINRRADTEFIYADDRRVEGGGGSIEAFFKPDWSPDLLLARNYIGRAFCVQSALVKRLQISLAEIMPYDLVLQCTERAEAICHVPLVLCEYVAPVESRQDKKALRQAVSRRKLNVAVENGLSQSTFRLRPKAKQNELVQVILRPVPPAA